MKKINKIHSTKTILSKLDKCILNKEPFSIMRFGDAVFGILTAFFCPEVITVGKWSGSKGQKLANNILGQLTIPVGDRNDICQRIVDSANRADYIDSYDAYLRLNRRRLGILARNWKQIHEGSGITNTSYCSCFVHYFSIVENELNLFDIMRGKKIFCITSRLICLDELQKKSNASIIDSYRIPRRGRKAAHYRMYFNSVMRLIRKKATQYDLFLIGGGLLGKIYCDQVKIHGGRAFDAGRLFDFWSNVRTIDSAPKRFLRYNNKKMLCERIKTPKYGKGIW